MVYAMFLFTKSRNGVSGKELQRQLDVTYKTAWRMMGRKIREHMARVDGDTPLAGSGKTVQVDEDFIGGRVKFLFLKVSGWTATAIKHPKRTYQIL